MLSADSSQDMKKLDLELVHQLDELSSKLDEYFDYPAIPLPPG